MSKINYHKLNLNLLNEVLSYDERKLNTNDSVWFEGRKAGPYIITASDSKNVVLEGHSWPKYYLDVIAINAKGEKLITCPQWLLKNNLG